MHEDVLEIVLDWLRERRRQRPPSAAEVVNLVEQEEDREEKTPREDTEAETILDEEELLAFTEAKDAERLLSALPEASFNRRRLSRYGAPSSLLLHEARDRREDFMREIVLHMAPYIYESLSQRHSLKRVRHVLSKHT